MCDASQADRNSMPRGIWFFQKAIGLPNTRGSTPAARKWAATARPYGPAPIIATEQAVIPLLVSLDLSRTQYTPKAAVRRRSTLTALSAFSRCQGVKEDS